jgi:hypothetical protein
MILINTESEIQLGVLNDRLSNYDQEKNNEMSDDDDVGN